MKSDSVSRLRSVKLVACRQKDEILSLRSLNNSAYFQDVCYGKQTCEDVQSQISQLPGMHEPHLQIFKFPSGYPSITLCCMLFQFGFHIYKCERKKKFSLHDSHSKNLGLECCHQGRCHYLERLSPSSLLDKKSGICII